MVKELSFVPADFKHSVFHLDVNVVTDKINECIRALNNLEALNTSTNKPSACASQIAALAHFCCECGSKFEFGENFCGKCGKARQLRTW